MKWPFFVHHVTLRRSGCAVRWDMHSRPPQTFNALRMGSRPFASTCDHSDEKRIAHSVQRVASCRVAHSCAKGHVSGVAEQRRSTAVLLKRPAPFRFRPPSTPLGSGVRSLTFLLPSKVVWWWDMHSRPPQTFNALRMGSRPFASTCDHSDEKRSAHSVQRVASCLYMCLQGEGEREREPLPSCFPLTSMGTRRQHIHPQTL